MHHSSPYYAKNWGQIWNGKR